MGQKFIKESTTHSIEQAGQWPTSVALDKPTLIGLGRRDVDIINRLSRIQCDRENREHLKYLRNIYCVMTNQSKDQGTWMEFSFSTPDWLFSWNTITFQKYFWWCLTCKKLFLTVRYWTVKGWAGKVSVQILGSLQWNVIIKSCNKANMVRKNKRNIYSNTWQ